MSDSPAEARKLLNTLQSEYDDQLLFEAATTADRTPRSNAMLRLDEDDRDDLMAVIETLDPPEIAGDLAGDRTRADEIPDLDKEAVITLVSRARPLTPSANADLQQFEPVERVMAGEIENPPLGVGDDTLVGYRLAERPPEDVIEQYQLDVEDDDTRQGPPDEFMENNDMGVSVNDTEIRVPLSVGGFEWASPSDDPDAGLGQGPTTVARWRRGPLPAEQEGSDVVAVRGRGTNYRGFWWPNGNRDERETLVGPVGGVEAVRKTVDAIEDLDTLAGSEAQGVEETPQGTAAMQEAGLSGSEIVREVFVEGQPGDRKFNFEDGIGERNTTAIAAPVFMEAQEELKSKLGNPEDFAPGQSVGEVFFEDSSSGMEFIGAEVDRAGAELEDDRFGDDSGTFTREIGGGEPDPDDPLEVVVQLQQGAVRTYDVVGGARFDRKTNGLSTAVKKEIGPAAQYERGATVGYILEADLNSGAFDKFSPVSDLTEIAEYDGEVDASTQVVRDIQTTDISFQITGGNIELEYEYIVDRVLRGELGEPTEYPDNAVVARIGFERRNSPEYVIAAIEPRVSQDGFDDQNDVIETDLGGLEPERVDDSGSTAEQQTFEPSDTNDDPPEFPTEPDEATRRARQQQNQQQQSLTGGEPDISPEAQREAERKREQREKRARQRQSDDQATLGGVGDDGDELQSLSEFGSDDDGDSGN